MRVGLVSVVRRVWAPVGVKVRQRVQQVRKWRYLVLAIEVWSGPVMVVLDGHHAQRGDRQRSPGVAAEH